MAAPQMEMKEQNIQGGFTTAEVTHLMESALMEQHCYMDNHLKMQLSGTEGVIREYHDNATRPNMDRVLKGLADMGVPAPFTKSLEDRENEIKAKMQGANIAGTITEGEAIKGVVINAQAMINWYSTSYTLTSNEKCADIFRQNMQTLMDQRMSLERSLRNTPEYVTPPQAQTVKLVGAHAKGIAANKARGV